MVQRARRRFANSKFVIAVGSALMIGLIMVLTAIGLRHMASINTDLETVASRHYERTAILTAMHRIVRERSLSMYYIYLTEDPFARDDEFMHFNDMAEDFIKLRLRFTEAGIPEREQALFDHAMQMIRRSAPLQERIVDQMMDKTATDVYTLMSAIDLPLEKTTLKAFDDMVDMERDYAAQTVALAQRDYQTAYRTMLMLGGLVAALGVLITFFVIRRASRIERDLHAAKEQAEVTLHAIGDAVITTDAEGAVVYLNPIAELLTGWALAEAYGKPLGEVYRLKDRRGGKDIQHPIANGPLDGRVSALSQHATLTSRSGHEYIVQDSASPLKGHDQRIFGAVLVSRDVTHEQNLSQQLNWQASHDSLTGLPNRRQFERVLEGLLKTARTSDLQHALLYIDLDQFKLVNDTCGHIAGDELLKQLALVLQSRIRDRDLLARLGGDEFAVLLRHCGLEQAERVASTILECIQDFRFVWRDKTFSLGASIGVVVIDELSRNRTTVLSAADAACYIAKDKGRNRVWIHHPDDDDVVKHHGEMEWASRITAALENDYFVLHQQKVMPLTDSSAPIYHELLVRMHNPNDNIVSPMAFIPAAERYGIMPAVDRWVIHQSLSWLARHRHLLGKGHIYAINLSGQTLGDDGFLRFCIKQFVETNVAPSNICFEITETAAIANLTLASQFITALKAQGCYFALDDFGSGMSSFAYLKNLDVDFVKIDGTFVKDMATDPVDRVMVAAIHQVGHVLGIKTIAEFVENDAIIRELKAIGVDYAQGYGIHRPQPFISLPAHALPNVADTGG